MRTTISTAGSDGLEARFGARIAGRLSAGSQDLPHDIAERLRAGREQAMARRKLVQASTAPVVASVGRDGAMTLGSGWWTRIASALPLVALAAGLVAISMLQDDNRATEVAEVDAAILTGDLPTAAYTDPGFAQFLKSDADLAR
ncbi:MAG: DUF3619 family protein [Proteobacteria bacterium]|nr:DUF3619 family protein [Pseudomonadota bacterium]